MSINKKALKENSHTSLQSPLLYKNNAILYDFLLVKGGAEAVSMLLYSQFANLDLGISFINSQAFSNNEFNAGPVHTLCEPTYILGWQTIKTSFSFWFKRRLFKHYNRIIFSGSYSLFASFGRPSNTNILYCHTPPRFVYDLRNLYLSTIKPWQRPLFKLLIIGFKPLYEKSLNNISVIIANSVNVKLRIKKYLNRDSAVIYPPCNTTQYKWIEQKDFYLSTARVESYKRVCLLIEAFKEMPHKQLVVASGGSELDSLKLKASGCTNIHFTGWCSFEKLQELVGTCIATLYIPMDEDFGMSPIESMAAGKPCIGVNEGGVKETVVNNKTGILCPENPSVDDVIAAVNIMTKETALSMRANCEKHAAQFSEEIFINKMRIIMETDEQHLHQTVMSLCATKSSSSLS